MTTIGSFKKNFLIYIFFNKPDLPGSDADRELMLKHPLHRVGRGRGEGGGGGGKSLFLSLFGPRAKSTYCKFHCRKVILLLERWAVTSPFLVEELVNFPYNFKPLRKKKISIVFSVFSIFCLIGHYSISLGSVVHIVQCNIPKPASY